MSTISVLNAAFAGGGRTSRYGDFTVVFLQSCSFATTALEYQQVTNWARGRMSRGIPHNDRMAFVERFETVLARLGSGIATKGSNKVLASIVKGMKANGMAIDEWSIPHNMNDGVEIKKRAPAAAADVAAEPVAPDAV